MKSQTQFSGEYIEAIFDYKGFLNGYRQQAESCPTNHICRVMHIILARGALSLLDLYEVYLGVNR